MVSSAKAEWDGECVAVANGLPKAVTSGLKTPFTDGGEGSLIKRGMAARLRDLDGGDFS